MSRGPPTICSTTYQGLPGDVSVGDRLLIDDGKVAVRVIAVDGPRVQTEVLEGGMVSDHKGINLPGVAVSVPAMSEKDLEDLRWGLQIGADLIALSFVRSAKDIDDVHQVMDQLGIRLPVFAKIEKPQAVDNLDEIVAAFDGVMVARGDLGVELPLEKVPLVQKRIVATAARGLQAGDRGDPDARVDDRREPARPGPRPPTSPTRSSTAPTRSCSRARPRVGRYPIETVATMSRIVDAVESEALDRLPALITRGHTKGAAICEAATRVAETVGARVPRRVHADGVERAACSPATAPRSR